MKLHQLNGFIQNIYLVEDNNKLMLLDGCSRPDVEIIFDYIKNKLNLPIQSLKTVVVTHLHPDHAGAAALLKKLTGCKLVGANVEGQWYRGIDGFFMHLTDIALAHWVGKRLGKTKSKLFYHRHLKFDILLNHRDHIPGFEDWQVLFTQGHTDRDLSVYHEQSKQIYVADLLVKVKGKFIPPFPVFYPNRYTRSIKLLQTLPVSHVLLAHGGKQEKHRLDFEHIHQVSPKTPQTHWRSVKKKLFKSLS